MFTGLWGRCYDNINVEIGRFRVEDAATKIGCAIDAMTNGSTGFEEVGRAIDDATKNITISIKRD